MKEIDEEAVVAEMEIRALVDKVLEIGDGDVIVGCLKAVEEDFRFELQSQQAGS